MQESRLIKHITTGTFTLPATALAVCALWLIGGFADGRSWAGLAATGLTAYLLMELNNRNALLRVRSRMVSVTYLALTAACPALHGWDTAMVPALCLVAAYFPLFGAYQQKQTAAYVFHAFALISAGSLCYPPLLLFLPVFCFCLAAQLRALSWRSFWAGVAGAALPYWFVLALAVWRGNFPAVFEPMAEAFHFEAPRYAGLELWQAAAGAFVGVLSLTGIVHLLRKAYNDKIRTRMLLYAITVTEIFLLAATALQPQHFEVLFRLLTVNSAPLIAHYLTLARSRRMTLWFVGWLVMLAALFIFNYALPCRQSLIFS